LQHQKEAILVLRNEIKRKDAEIDGLKKESVPTPQSGTIPPPPPDLSTPFCARAHTHTHKLHTLSRGSTVRPLLSVFLCPSRPRFVSLSLDQTYIHIHTYIHTYIHTCVCVSVCLSVSLSVCLSVCLSVFLSVFLSVCKITSQIFLFFVVEFLLTVARTVEHTAQVHRLCDCWLTRMNSDRYAVISFV
jgi:hypothetical protein